MIKCLKILKGYKKHGDKFTEYKTRRQNVMFVNDKYRLDK